MIETNFVLKPEEKQEFTEGMIEFKIHNKSNKKRKIKVEIR